MRVPRDLADVLHYFIPEAGPSVRTAAEEPNPPQQLSPRNDGDRAPALAAVAPARGSRLLSVLIADQDVVRAALVWNVAIEIARLGDPASILTPRCGDDSGLWPGLGDGPLGSEVVAAPVRDLSELAQAARARSQSASERSLLLLRLPPTWIVRSATSSVATSLLDWTLILSSPEPRDLMDSYALAKRVFALRPRARIGVAIHGVRDAKEAARAFGRLADVVERRLERQLVSYGSLIDDLQIYRAIVAKRPIGLAYPQSAAAKALADLATRLLRDAPAAAHG